MCIRDRDGKYVNILAMEMASPGNRHCASSICALSFPIVRNVSVSAARTVAFFPNLNALVAASKEMPTVILCLDKIPQFVNWGCW